MHCVPFSHRTLPTLVSIEGSGGIRAGANFREIEHCQNNSKFRMRVCSCVLNIVLYFFALLSALFPRNYACKNWTLTKETVCSAKQ